MLLQQAPLKEDPASKGPQEFRIPTQSKLISTWRAKKFWLSRQICRATALLEFGREGFLCVSEKVAASVQMMRNLNCLLL